MSICPVCGCKTDELDFVLCTIEKNEEMVCSFCEKQIKKLYAEETPATAQVRWLNSVIEKDVPARGQSLFGALIDMQKRFSPENDEKETASAIGNQIKSIKRDVNVQSGFSGGDLNVSVDQYNDLLKRLEKLEGDFAKYRKTQLLKMIVELGLPIVLAIIIAIVFFASGLYDSLSMLTSIY